MAINTKITNVTHLYAQFKSSFRISEQYPQSLVKIFQLNDFKYFWMLFGTLTTLEDGLQHMHNIRKPKPPAHTKMPTGYVSQAKVNTNLVRYGDGRFVGL